MTGLILFAAAALAAGSAPDVDITCKWENGSGGVMFTLSETRGTASAEYASGAVVTGQVQFMPSQVMIQTDQFGGVAIVDRTSLRISRGVVANGSYHETGKGQCKLLDVSSRQF